jgi:GT2 family glycosyltransferase
VPALATDTQPARYRGRLARDVLAGWHMAARRQVFADVGGFDARLGAGSRFPAADDNDLGFRLLKAGYEIVYAPEPVVYHRAWRPGSEYLPMRWRYGRGKGGFYAKHLPTEPRYMLGRLARDIGRRAWGFVGRLRRDPRGAAGDVTYSLGVLVGVVQWSLGLRKIR